jgi:hypothetical protein
MVKSYRSSGGRDERSRETLRAALFEVLDNQLRDNNPPETGETLVRLKAAGLTEAESRNLIAAVISQEIFDILSSKLPASNDRYIANLRRLPTMPWD